MDLSVVLQAAFTLQYQLGALSLLQLEGFSHHHQLEAFFLLPQSAVSAVSVVLVALVEWEDLEDLVAWVVEALEVLVDSTEIPSALLSLAPHQTDSKPVVGNLAEQVDLAESVESVASLKIIRKRSTPKVKLYDFGQLWSYHSFLLYYSLKYLSFLLRNFFLCCLSLDIIVNYEFKVFFWVYVLPF
ncbi:expressed protein [Phakopsora pachyrhizi]|uniref:Expressed protein n=1 Tax=Phakopsora pachyrhizi TaxID=170000 RepID=A0AAV0AVV9_PHAPC|nr:expressed protein [Phakopsora pachyrhizi]